LKQKKGFLTKSRKLGKSGKIGIALLALGGGANAAEEINHDNIKIKQDESADKVKKLHDSNMAKFKLLNDQKNSNK
jgi:hypothetical protein